MGRNWYYHFLSGSDLPIKPKEFIYNYFESPWEGYNFLVSNPADQFIFRFRFYYGFFRAKWLPSKLNEILNNKIMEYQQKFNIDRTRWLLKHYPLIGKGHNWCDLTQDAVEELILHEDSIRRFCRYAHCPDELYKQIILLNSSNMNVKKFVPHDIRFIDWSVGESHPKTYKKCDFNMIMASDAILQENLMKMWILKSLIKFLRN